MLITIPSRSRADKIAAFIERLPIDARLNTIVFVPYSQRDQYLKALDKHSSPVVTLSDDFRMPEVRDFMGKFAAMQSAEYFLMVDDDVHFETRLGPDTTKTGPCTLNDTARCLEHIEFVLREGYHGQVGLPPRMFQNHTPAGHPETLFKECTRNACVTGWRTEDFLKINYCRVPVRSDFDATLQLLRLGRKNINLHYWQHNQVNNTAGGCSDYRTTTLADAAAYQLEALHPGLVKVVAKEYPAQMRRENLNMGKRLEVTIQWRKALGWDVRNGG